MGAILAAARLENTDRDACSLLLAADWLGTRMSFTHHPVCDQDLMILIKGDDARAFDAFYDRHSSVAFSLAMQILNDRGLAADATQEAFLACWRNRADYQPSQSAGRSWLLSIVRHRAIDTWRRERGPRGDIRGDAHLAQQQAPDCTEEQATAPQIARDQQRSIRVLLAELPPEQRQVVELSYFGGLTHTEIANRLGQPLGTTKGQMRLALHKLRNAMDEQDLAA